MSPKTVRIMRGVSVLASSLPLIYYNSDVRCMDLFAGLLLGIAVYDIWRGLTEP